ncbi:hypothetical protein ERO13_A09G053166v2 [Gossypium hirsutum]|nr:hypothetical protein ERO13_A09G053166v2 [Gossypium hirsutum]
MSVLLKSFLILSFRARALPVFPSILTPKSLPRNRRTRTLSSISASTFQSPPPSISPETPTRIPPLSDSLHWVSCTACCGDLSNQDVGFRVRLCGWVALHRVHGGLTFFNLRDHTGIVQVFTYFQLFSINEIVNFHPRFNQNTDPNQDIRVRLLPFEQLFPITVGFPIWP